tara:strand:+ start:30002 stop:30193 length:192 start_codon:yes stop_codon:yes gene_type:complete
MLVQIVVEKLNIWKGGKKMKCPNCEEGKMKMKSHRKVTNLYSKFINDKGVLECDSCGYREVFD